MLQGLREDSGTFVGQAALTQVQLCEHATVGVTHESVDEVLQHADGDGVARYVQALQVVGVANHVPHSALSHGGCG